MVANGLPTLSIVTAVLNRGRTIETALESLRAQRYAGWEHIVQDGGSTDETMAVLKRFADSRRTIVSEADAGIYDALNRACARCSGDILGVLHSDDFYPADDVLETVAARFADEDIDAVYGDLEYVAASNPDRVIRRWRAGEYRPARLKWGWMPPHPALFIRRRVFEQYGDYDDGLRIAADYEAMLRWMVQGRLRMAYVPRVLMRMRLGGASNGSVSRLLRKSREDLMAMRRHGVGSVPTLLCKNLRKLPQFWKGRYGT